MTSYRPLTDMMIMARPKVPFHGAFPSGSLVRMRDLLGVCITTPLLHVCAGRVRDYPFAGFGPNDRTLDLDQDLKPDYHTDAREIGALPGDLFPVGVVDGRALPVDHCHVRRVEKGNEPPVSDLWPAVLVDRPYTEEDAANYLGGKGADYFPDIHDLLRRCLTLVSPGGRVGVLDYVFPRPPRTGVRLVATTGMLQGYGNSIRGYYVYERLVAKDAPSEDGLPADAGAATDERPRSARTKGRRKGAKEPGPAAPAAEAPAPAPAPVPASVPAADAAMDII